MHPPVLDLYAVFDVTRAASHEELAARHRALVRRHHPDGGGDADAIRAVNHAWETLGNPARRRAYDAFLLGLQREGARPEDIVEQLAYEGMQDAGRSGRHPDSLALEAAEMAWQVLGDVACDAALRARARAQQRAVAEHRRRLPNPDSVMGTAISGAHARRSETASAAGIPRSSSGMSCAGPRPLSFLVPDLWTILNTTLLDDFARGIVDGEWRLIVGGEVFACLGHLETEAPSSLRQRVLEVLGIIARTAMEPPDRRRIFTETSNYLGVADTVSHLLSAMQGTSATVIAETISDQVRLRAALAKWGQRARVGGPALWEQISGHELRYRRAGSMQPRRSFQQRVHRNFVRGGYAGLLAIAFAVPGAAWDLLPVRFPMAAYALLWAAAAWSLIRLFRGAGRALEGTWLARRLAPFDGALTPEHRGVFWLGFVLCAMATLGLSIVITGVGLALGSGTRRSVA